MSDQQDDMGIELLLQKTEAIRLHAAQVRQESAQLNQQAAAFRRAAHEMRRAREEIRQAVGKRLNGQTSESTRGC